MPAPSHEVSAHTSAAVWVEEAGAGLGYTRPVRNKPVGSMIGAISGLVFVLVNAGAVPWTSIWRVAAVVAAVAIVWFVVVRGPSVEHEPPNRDAVRTYGFSVTAMIVLIPVGASVITNVLDKPNAVVVWVVFVVGAHFVPFARAFDLTVFHWLAAAMMLVAVVGAVPTLTSNSAMAAGWTGVAAGFVVLVFSAAGPRLMRARVATPRTAA